MSVMKSTFLFAVLALAVSCGETAEQQDEVVGLLETDVCLQQDDGTLQPVDRAGEYNEELFFCSAEEDQWQKKGSLASDAPGVDSLCIRNCGVTSITRFRVTWGCGGWPRIDRGSCCSGNLIDRRNDPGNNEPYQC